MSAAESHLANRATGRRFTRPFDDKKHIDSLRWVTWPNLALELKEATRTASRYRAFLGSYFTFPAAD